MKKFMSVIFTLILYSTASYAQFDHNHLLMNQLLSKFTEKIGFQTLTHYNKIKDDPSLLGSYLTTLENVTESEFKQFSEKEKLAFWINAYNAYTIKLIIDHYPIKSIKDIESGLFSRGPWKIEFIHLLGRKLSLDDIEHGIIRKEFNEPRIHFAVNCASIGCPSLLREAFQASQIEHQLDISALNFLSNKDKNRVEGKVMKLSKIFKWYGGDFEQKYGTFQNYILKVLSLPSQKYDIEYNEYDWNLNEGK